MKMNPKDHKARHQFLHKCFDELLADFMKLTGKSISKTPLEELIKWSHAQTIKPDVKKNG